MNATVIKALLIAIPVAVSFVASVALFKRTRAVAWLLRCGGSACFGIVVLAHVAEGMRWFPRMGWGQPASPGHYLDLTSAVLGAMLLVLGTIPSLPGRPRGHNRPACTPK